MLTLLLHIDFFYCLSCHDFVNVIRLLVMSYVIFEIKKKKNKKIEILLFSFAQTMEVGQAYDCRFKSPFTAVVAGGTVGSYIGACYQLM